MGATVEEIIINLRVQQIGARKQLSKVQKQVQKTGKNMIGLARAEQKVAVTTNKLKRAMGETPFAGWAMSIMFAGMALQRMFTMIWRSSSKTFGEVMHSVEGTTTSFDKLEGSMKFLGFTMGAALEPIAEKMIPIINAISEWIGEHEALTRLIMKTMGIGGTFLMVWGMAKLGINGVRDSMIAVKKTILWLNKNILQKLFSESLETRVSKISKWLNVSIKDALKWIKANPVKAIMTAGAIAGIIAAVWWLFQIREEVGGWKNVFKLALAGIGKTAGALAAVFETLGVIIKNVFSGEEIGNFAKIFKEKLNKNVLQVEQQLGIEELMAQRKTRLTFGDIIKGDIMRDEVEGATQVTIQNLNLESTNLDDLLSQINAAAGGTE